MQTLTFADATVVNVEQAYIDGNSNLCIKTSGFTSGYLTSLFTDTTKTQRMVISNGDRVIDTFSGYIELKGLMHYISGPLEVVMGKVSSLLIEQVTKNSNDISDLDDAVSELAEIIGEE